MSKHLIIRSLVIALLVEAQQQQVAAYAPRAAFPHRRGNGRRTLSALGSEAPDCEDSNYEDDGSSSPPAPVDSFNAFVEMRTGLGTGPGSSDVVFWAGSGELYEAYSGKILAKYEGFDVSRGVRLGPDHVLQLSRKIFWFRDKDTGEVLTEYEGKPVRPIKYDYQVFDFRRSDDGINGEVGTPSGGQDGGDPAALPPILPSVVSGPRVVPVMPITARTAGADRLTFQAPVFIDVDIPNVGPYQAWEFYDYTVDLSYAEDRRPLALWCRQGSTAPFVDDGRGVMRFQGTRIDAFEELPESMRELVGNGYELFREPPVDMDEIERLHHEAALRSKQR